MQRPHGVGQQQVVAHVAFGEEDEAVVTKTTVFGGTRDQIRQVQAARRELLQDRDETAGLVGALIHHQRGSIVTGT